MSFTVKQECREEAGESVVDKVDMRVVSGVNSFKFKKEMGSQWSLNHDNGRGQLTKLEENRAGLES